MRSSGAFFTAFTGRPALSRTIAPLPPTPRQIRPPCRRAKGLARLAVQALGRGLVRALERGNFRPVRSRAPDTPSLIEETVWVFVSPACPSRAGHAAPRQ